MKRKRIRKDEEAVSPVIAIILMVAITVVLAGVLYLWVSDLASQNRSTLDPMSFRVQDGTDDGIDNNVFFLIRAERGVSLDPARYSFFVANKDHSPVKLDFSLRGGDINNPTGGDRSEDYTYTDNGELWSDGEYIGFCMPTDEMNIDIQDGAVYEVLMKNPEGDVIYKDTFVYSTQVA